MKGLVLSLNECKGLVWLYIYLFSFVCSVNL